MSSLPVNFIVATSFRLPGLGMLVLPAFPAPAWLDDYALHTAVDITLLAGSQPPSSFTGTIEEVVRDNQPAQRALLVDFSPNDVLLPGTLLQVVEVQSQLL